jgi:hypothetical protein
MRRVTAELALGLAGVPFLGEAVREKTGLRTFRYIFSTKQSTPVRPKDSAALGTLSDSLRFLGLTHISGVQISDLILAPSRLDKFQTPFL